MMDPPVWLPRASGTMPAATAAAEPLEEPPGVWPGWCGLRVLPGVRVANSVVTVLPMNRAGGPQALRHRRVAGRRPPRVQHRPVLGRHVRAVDDVLERDRPPLQRAEAPPGSPP